MTYQELRDYWVPAAKALIPDSEFTKHPSPRKGNRGHWRYYALDDLLGIEEYEWGYYRSKTHPRRNGRPVGQPISDDLKRLLIMLAGPHGKTIYAALKATREDYLPRHIYTEQDLSTFMEMWNQYQTTEAIGRALGRSPESVVQKARLLGLRRDYHTVRMVSVYGADILQHGLTPDAIKKAMLAAKRRDHALKLKAAKKKQRQAIVDFRNNISRYGRLVAMKIAATELSLRQIGEIMGVSKQAISKRLKRKT